MVEEPWLNDRDTRFRALGAEAQAHRETLSTTGEVPWVEQVEVRLLKGEEAHDAVDRTEASADADRARSPLLNEHVHVSIASTARRAARLHFAEILQAFEARLGGFQLDGVEHVAGLQRDFTADHLVLGLGVARDVHAAHLVAGAFGDAIDDVHPVRSGVPDVGVYGSIGISARAVVTADHRDVRPHLLRGVGVVRVEGQGRIEFLGFEDRHLAETNARHRVFFAFVDLDHQIHSAILDGLAADSRAARTEITLAAIVIEDRI